MSDYGDDSDYEYFDLDFLDDYTYVEDAYHAADDLAEHVVASPPPFEDAQDYWDWDRFDYWQDIEDGSLGYFDYVGGKGAINRQQAHSGRSVQKGNAKQRATRTPKQAVRSDRKNAPLSPTPTVAWRSQESRYQVAVPDLKLEEQEPIAILKDWKEQFKNSSLAKRRLEFNQKASGKSDIISDAPPSPSPEPSGDPLQMDEAIQAVLASKLGSAGLPQGFDTNTLLEYAMRMLQGPENADDIAAELAEQMLDHDDDSPMAESITKFIAQQKTLVNNDSADAIPYQQTPAATKSHVQVPTPSSTETLESTRERAASPLTPNVIGETVRQASLPTPQEVTSRKRKADDAVPDADEAPSRPKRTHRTFDAPTTSSAARSTSRTVSRSTRRSGKK